MIEWLFGKLFPPRLPRLTASELKVWNQPLYSEANFQALALLLVQVWRPTEPSEEQREAYLRAKYLAGYNFQGIRLVMKVLEILG